MTEPGRRIVLISPVRDEEKYIEKTIQSVASQTILPVEWVIVDDGSTDGTGRFWRGLRRNIHGFT